MSVSDRHLTWRWMSRNEDYAEGLEAGCFVGLRTEGQ